MSKKVLFLVLIIALKGYCDLQDEKKDVNKRTSKLFFIGKAEYFEPRDKEVRKDYESEDGGLFGEGSDIGFSIGGGIPLSPSFSLIASLSSYKIANERRSLNITPFTLSCIYNLSTKTPTSYIGGGIGYYSVERKELSESKRNKAIGYLLLAGTDWLISPRIGINGEIRYSRAKIKEWGMDISGLSASAGISLTLGKGRFLEFERWKKEPKKGRITGTILGTINVGMIGFLFYIIGGGIAVGLGGSSPAELSPLSIIIAPAIIGGMIGYDIGDRYDKKTRKREEK